MRRAQAAGVSNRVSLRSPFGGAVGSIISFFSTNRASCDKCMEMERLRAAELRRVAGDALDLALVDAIL